MGRRGGRDGRSPRLLNVNADDVAAAVAGATVSLLDSSGNPILVNGVRPRPMYVDYKDLELLSKLTNRHGRIVSFESSSRSL